MKFTSREKRRKTYMKRITIAVAIAVIVIGGIGFWVKVIDSNKGKENLTKVQAKKETKGKTPTSLKKVEKPKPTDIMKNGNIIYAADSYAVSADQVALMLQGKSKDTHKEVFLTFDDGPSENTREILKILKDEGVHATFFDVGSALKDNKTNLELLKKEIDEGNAVADHSFSHDYRILYPGNSVDVNTFMNEIKESNEIMRSVLGNNFEARVVRMPGGYMSRRYYKDPHLKALDEAFAKNNIVSIDWDAETGDATGRHYSVEQYVRNSAKHLSSLNHVILLMHDAAAKKETVTALPAIIKFFKGKGYEFKVIKNSPIKTVKQQATQESSSNTPKKS